MDQFVYSDIFDTKGIEYIVVIAFLLLMIPFWIMLNRPVAWKNTITEALKVLSAQALRIPQGLFYNRNHTWLHLEKSGVALLGMDDLLLHLTGGVEVTYLKARQERVSRGEPIARITQEGKNLLISSPISGQIESVHSSLEKNGGELSEDPYGSWLLKIKPEKWKDETVDCYLGEEASRWTEQELDRFKDFMAEEAKKSAGSEALVLQAGGELVDHPLREMDQEVWSGFQSMFLTMD